MAEIEKRQEIENHVAPVEEEHHEEPAGECRQLDISPDELAAAAFPQFPANCTNIVAEKTEEDVTPGVLRFAIVPVFVDRDPIGRFTVLIWPIGIAFMMLHVHRIVICLRKTARNRLGDSKEAIEQLRAKEGVVNEIVSDPIDVCVDHQRVNKSEDQHHPKRDVRIKEEQAQEIGEMKKTRRGGDGVPARVRK